MRVLTTCTRSHQTKPRLRRLERASSIAPSVRRCLSTRHTKCSFDATTPLVRSFIPSASASEKKCARLHSLSRKKKTQRSVPRVSRLGAPRCNYEELQSCSQSAQRTPHGRTPSPLDDSEFQSPRSPQRKCKPWCFQSVPRQRPAPRRHCVATRTVCTSRFRYPLALCFVHSMTHVHHPSRRLRLRAAVQLLSPEPTIDDTCLSIRHS